MSDVATSKSTLFLMAFKSIRIFLKNKFMFADGDTVGGISARYGMDELGIESRCGRDFSHPSRRALRPTQSLVQFPGIKWPGHDVNHTLPSNTEVKKSSAMPLLPFWAFMNGSRVKFAFFIYVLRCNYVYILK
jgi:hypothetical protein